MNMHTGKSLPKAVSPSELLALAEGDVDILLNSRLRTRDGRTYYSRRLILLNLQKKKDSENAKRNQSSDGQRSAPISGDCESPEGVGSLKLALKKFFSQLFGGAKPS